jgi:ribosomal protein S12 methylthiotransferase accessory factor YcaO
MNSNEPEQSAAEMRSLLGFASGLGLDEATVREIYEAVGREAMVTGASDDTRMAEVRKGMMAAAGDAHDRG